MNVIFPETVTFEQIRAIADDLGLGLKAVDSKTLRIEPKQSPMANVRVLKRAPVTPIRNQHPTFDGPSAA